MTKRTRSQRRYELHVRSVALGAHWGVALELKDAIGTVVHRYPPIPELFDRPEEAQAAGARIADVWISELGRVEGGTTFGTVPPPERALLLYCDHYVARCNDCRLHHHVFELVDQRLCARCRSDLAPALRRHLIECSEIVIARAPVPSEPDRPAAVPSRRVCDLCDASIDPGATVSFQRGRLVHGACYEARLRGT